VKQIHMPWYKEWTGVTPSPDNVKFVYAEFTGRTMAWDLQEDYGIYEGPSPTKETPGWKAPRRIVVENLMPARLAELKRVAPDVEFIPVKTAEDAAKNVEDAGADKDLVPEVVHSNVVVTNTSRIYGPEVADQAFALLLSLTRQTTAGMR